MLKHAYSAYGFTLAELLIALAILGVIATFSIPKVLVSQQDAKRKAIFRETIAALSDITQQAARLSQGFSDVNEEQAFFASRLNYVKRCATDPVAEGCWRETLSGWGGSGNVDAYLLHNGACLTSINGGAGTDRETIAIDWDCRSSAAAADADIISVIACFGPNDCDTGVNAIAGSGPKKAGVLGPQGGPGEALYQAVFE